jgi:two-component system, NarL family, invasion response regulator UvrY
MIRLLIIDDHSVVRQGIRQILADMEDIVVGGEATNAAEGLERARAEQWDAVVLDLNLPGTHGLDLLKQLRHEQETIPILVLSMHAEDQFALRAIRAGASGYLTKNSAPHDLVNAIRTIVSGRHYVSAWLAERLAREATGDPSKAAHEQLSDREYQVMMRIASGKSIKEIAAEMNISPKTVGTYRSRLAEKMNLTSDAELTAYVFRNHLLE